MFPWSPWSRKDEERIRAMSGAQRLAVVVAGLAVAAVVLVILWVVLS
jgi:type IV secretory pathway TrbD component